MGEAEDRRLSRLRRALAEVRANPQALKVLQDALPVLGRLYEGLLIGETQAAPEERADGLAVYGVLLEFVRDLERNVERPAQVAVPRGLPSKRKG